MKKTFLLCTATLAVLGLALLIGAPKVLSHPSPAPAAVAAPAAAPATIAAPAAEPQEHHPELNSAIRSLEEAKRHLESIQREDPGSHRMKAVEHIDKALDECREARRLAPSD
jgi:hypothetical protein